MPSTLGIIARELTSAAVILKGLISGTLDLAVRVLSAGIFVTQFWKDLESWQRT